MGYPLEGELGEGNGILKEWDAPVAQDALVAVNVSDATLDDGGIQEATVGDA